MKLKEFKNKKIVVIGLGLQGGGVEIAKFLSKNKAIVSVTDLRSKKELKPSLEKLKGLPIKYYFGRHPQKIFKNADIIIKNPAVPNNSPYLKIAKKAGAEIESEIGIFINLQKGKIIAVTGTKGKTTTTSLIYRILKLAKKKVVLGGNLGKSLLSEISKIDSETYVLLELSSFQLELLKNNKNFKPKIAILTNIYEDHLDRYSPPAGGFQSYINAKKIIFQNQNKNDFAVINFNNKQCREIAKKIKARKIFFNFKSALGGSALGRREKKYLNDLDIPKTLRGDHNLENILAAVKTAKILKIPEKIIKEAIKNFPGIEHRIEFVREIKGVKYFNDSASTNPISAIAALDSFDKPIILIAGGADKNLNFSELGKKIAQKVKYLIIMGQTGPKIAKVVLKTNKKFRRVNIQKSADLKNAVLLAFKNAKAGDIVLFSPASASQDMFLNSKIRGKKFKKIIQSLR